MAKPRLPEVSTLIQAGIDPKTGLPIKWQLVVKDILKKILRNS